MSTLRSLVDLELFKNFGDDDIYSLSKVVTVQEHKSGVVIINDGDIGTEMYIVIKGCVDVVKDFGDGPEVLARLGPGEMFGEMAILDDTKRNATIRTAVDTETMVICKDHLQQFLNINLSAAYQFFLLLGKSINRRLRLLNLNFLFSQVTLDELGRAKGSLNLGEDYLPVSFYESLEGSEIEFLTSIGTVTEYTSGDIILDESEVARDLYLILDGDVSILKLLPSGEEVPLVDLESGNLFGEMSFLDDGFRSARARATAPTILLALNRQGIERNKSKDMLAVCKLFLVALQNIIHNIRQTTLIYNTVCDRIRANN